MWQLPRYFPLALFKYDLKSSRALPASSVYLLPPIWLRCLFYERLVGSVKRCLKKSLGKTLLSFPDIVTMVTEVAAVLNSRPLTYLYLDIEDNLPLTPAHFLCRYRLTTLPNLVQEKDVDPLLIPPSAQVPRSESKNFQEELDAMNHK